MIVTVSGEIWFIDFFGYSWPVIIIIIKKLSSYIYLEQRSQGRLNFYFCSITEIIKIYSGKFNKLLFFIKCLSRQIKQHLSICLKSFYMFNLKLIATVNRFCCNFNSVCSKVFADMSVYLFTLQPISFIQTCYSKSSLYFFLVYKSQWGPVDFHTIYNHIFQETSMQFFFNQLINGCYLWSSFLFFIF